MLFSVFEKMRNTNIRINNFIIIYFCNQHRYIKKKQCVLWRVSRTWRDNTRLKNEKSRKSLKICNNLEHLEKSEKSQDFKIFKFSSVFQFWKKSDCFDFEKKKKKTNFRFSDFQILENLEGFVLLKMSIQFLCMKMLNFPMLKNVSICVSRKNIDFF